MRKLFVIVSLWGVVALAGAAPAWAADLLTDANIQIDGAANGDFTGVSVAGAGDVNGDGLADVIVGAPYAENSRPDSGSAYVVFGRETASTVDLGAIAAGGFRIDGNDFEYAGRSVAGAGDVNGDGLADVIVGAPEADNNGGYGVASGSAYVIFGKATTSTVDLGALGTGGFRIDAASLLDEAGYSVAGAGDVNGDGLADVIVGARNSDNNARNDSGTAYVVFGKTTTTTVELWWLGAGGFLGADGFRIDGAAAGDHAGHSVAGAGDVNGDGRADVIVGANLADNNGRSDSGSAYVVFGPATAGTIDLAALGTGGFRIDGATAQDTAGASVAGAGDVNGDGTADVIVGAPGAYYTGSSGAITHSGSAYVVFGRATTSTVDLSAFGADGFRIDGATALETAGGSVAGLGDVNGDGRADLIVGEDGGASVVFGRGTTSTVDLGALGTGGFRIEDTDNWHQAFVAAAGDVNGDGAPDVIVGTPFADNNGRTDSGSAYVLFTQALWGYVWANDPTAPSYTPSTAYQRNSTGALNTIVRTGMGAYTVTFPNLGVHGGTVNVTAYGTGSEICKVRDWLKASSDLAVRVLCFAAGAPADARFTATFARTVGGSRWAYVWANQPNAALYTPSTLYQGNATGATNTIKRGSTGHYQVRLPGIGGPGGAVKVTAYGPGSEACKATGWSAGSSGTELVNVECENAAGVSADTQFTMTFHAEGGILGVPTDLGGERAYILADQPESPSYTPAEQFNSSGATNTITRPTVGVYTVHLPGLSVPRGHVQVTTYRSAHGDSCKVAGWAGKWSPDESVDVRCFKANGAPADVQFVMSFVD